MKLRLRTAITLVALAFISSGVVNSREERLQLGERAAETLTTEVAGQPKITRVHWSEGDLEILIDHPAPCGPWIAASPNWVITGKSVTLNYDWYQSLPAAIVSTSLCTKHLRAWVFRVPNRNYSVKLGALVPRFEQKNGEVRRVANATPNRSIERTR